MKGLGCFVYIQFSWNVLENGYKLWYNFVLVRAQLWTIHVAFPRVCVIFRKFFKRTQLRKRKGEERIMKKNISKNQQATKQKQAPVDVQKDTAEGNVLAAPITPASGTISPETPQSGNTTGTSGSTKPNTSGNGSERPSQSTKTSNSE